MLQRKVDAGRVENLKKQTKVNGAVVCRSKEKLALLEVKESQQPPFPSISKNDTALRELYKWTALLRRKILLVSRLNFQIDLNEAAKRLVFKLTLPLLN